MSMQNGTATLKDNLAVCYKTKYTLIIQSNYYAPWYLPTEAGNLCLQKNLHTYIYSIFILMIHLYSYSYGNYLPYLGSNQDVLQKENG